MKEIQEIIEAFVGTLMLFTLLILSMFMGGMLYV